MFENGLVKLYLTNNFVHLLYKKEGRREGVTHLLTLCLHEGSVWGPLRGQHCLT